MIELWAWISEGEDGDSHIIGANAEGLTLPLVFMNEQLVEITRPLAILHRRQSGRPVRLVRFHASQTVETLTDA